MAFKISAALIVILLGITIGLVYKEREVFISGNEILKEAYCVENYSNVPRTITPNQCLKYFK